MKQRKNYATPAMNIVEMPALNVLLFASNEYDGPANAPDIKQEKDWDPEWQDEL